MTTAHRGPTGNITLTFLLPAIMGAWDSHQIEITTETALELIEDLAHMVRQDAKEKPLG